MLKLKLTRMGGKKKPFYRIVVVDSAKRRDGEYLDRVGLYDPTKKEKLIDINEEKALKYLNMGAIPTDTVKSLLRKKGIWSKFANSKN